ncbi:MAG: UvrD-helicase domain-containing protein [Acidaminococcaceae bacterium]
MSEFTSSQKLAIETLDANVSVSAGAGSGKTRVLVERFVRIIAERKARPEEILAITFTRKAAKEMRERVRKTLAQLAVVAQGAEQRQFWQEQVKLLEKAQISTIDSFCSRILRENPVEAEIEPNFVTAEEFEIEEFYQAESLRYLQKKVKNKDAACLGLLEEYGRSRLQTLLLTLLPQLGELGAVANWQAPYHEVLGEELSIARWQLLELVRELVDLREKIKGKHREDLEQLFNHLEVVENAILQGKTAMELEPLQWIMTLGASNKLDKEMVQEAKLLALRLGDTPKDWRALELLPFWQQFLTGFEAYCSERKLAAGLLSFADIASRSLHLLGEQASVLEKVRSRFKYVMVDEFQDTNEEQRQLVYLIAGGQQDQLLGQRLFVVGDAKQSIYRFRGADVGVFAQVRKDIAQGGGKNIELADNFRSTEKILNCCNLVFQDLLGENLQDDVFFQKLSAHRQGRQLPVLTTLTVDKKEQKTGKHAEALVVVEQIKTLLKEDPQLSYGSIAILLATINNATAFVQHLREAGIPYHLVDGKGFYERQEIVDVVNLLEFLHNSQQSLSLAGILRSPYFGFSDDTLTLLFLARGEQSLWAYLVHKEYPQLTEIVSDRLRVAVDKLDRLRRVATALDLPELLKAIYEELQLAPLLKGQEFGQDKLANVEQLRASAGDFAMNQGGTLATYLERLRKLRAMQVRATTTTVSEGNEVKLMTIHKAKGLEFPVVFLPNLNTRVQGDSKEINFFPTIGLGIKVDDSEQGLVETTVFKKIKAVQKELEAAERKRQLYVAMTRAEDYLFMSGVEVQDTKTSSDSAETWFKSLQRVLGMQPSAVTLNLVSAATVTATGKEELKQPEPEPIAQSVYEQIKPLSACQGCNRNFFSASALQEYKLCPRSFYYQYVDKIPGREELGLARDTITGTVLLPAYLLGLAVHSALEYGQRMTDAAALKLALERQIPPHLQSSALKIVEPLLKSYKTSTLYKELAALPQEAEVDFTLPLFTLDGEQIWFTGSIDCLLHYADGTLGIVDYKTGTPPSPGEEHRGYLQQLAIYALAAEKLFKQKVSCAELHFLQNSTKQSLKLDKETLLEEVQATCQEIRSKKEEQDFAVLPQHCSFCSFNYFCRRR